MTKWRRYAWQGAAEFVLLADACGALVRIRLALWLLPWDRVIAIAGPQPIGRSPRFSVARLERAVRTAGRLVPRATCLTQALALNHLLSCDGHASTVQIGVRCQDGRFAAHAWVEWSGGPLLSSPAEVTQYARFLTWPPRVT